MLRTQTCFLLPPYVLWLHSSYHGDTGQLPAHESSADQFPGGAKWAPYPSGTSKGEEEAAYAWNPAGSGSAHIYLPLPVFRAHGEFGRELMQRASYNQHVVSHVTETALVTCSRGSTTSHPA